MDSRAATNLRATGDGLLSLAEAAAVLGIGGAAPDVALRRAVHALEARIGRLVAIRTPGARRPHLRLTLALLHEHWPECFRSETTVVTRAIAMLRDETESAVESARILSTARSAEVKRLAAELADAKREIAALSSRHESTQVDTRSPLTRPNP